MDHLMFAIGILGAFMVASGIVALRWPDADAREHVDAELDLDVVEEEGDN